MLGRERCCRVQEREREKEREREREAASHSASIRRTQMIRSSEKCKTEMLKSVRCKERREIEREREREEKKEKKGKNKILKIQRDGIGEKMAGDGKRTEVGTTTQNQRERESARERKRRGREIYIYIERERERDIYICRRVFRLSTFWPFRELLVCPPFCQNLISSQKQIESY